MTLQTDVAIVGAGAAGIAAARLLTAAGADVLLLEARDRAGGRAFTFQAEGFPLDLGAGWLHSADVNPLVGVLEAHGHAIDRTPPPWNRQSSNQDFPAEDQIEYRKVLNALEDKISAQAATGVDVPVESLMEPDCRWNGLLNAFSSAYNGAPFRDISAIDYDAYQDTGVNWRAPDGYGAGVVSLAPADTLRLGVTVSRIDHSGPLVRLITDQGELTARTVILAVPTSILAREALSFSPALPDKVEAAADLPLGLADKLLLHLDEPEAFPKDGFLFGSPLRPNSGGYHLRPFGRPLIELFVGGDTAWRLEAEGPHAITAFALEQLVHLLGADITGKVRPIAAHAWGADPLALGSYSYARPGRRAARSILAAPVENRLFFAGEACSPDFFSTVHGAWISGETAARAALASLARQA
jgi:monoamine oxidase